MTLPIQHWYTDTKKTDSGASFPDETFMSGFDFLQDARRIGLNVMTPPMNALRDFITYDHEESTSADINDLPDTYRLSTEPIFAAKLQKQRSSRHLGLDNLNQIVDQSAINEAIDQRLVELREAAYDDGITWSMSSERGLLGFIKRTGTTAVPFLTLRPDGNLRALWERSNGDQVGLQFIDRFKIGYVLFVAASDNEVDRHFGSTSRSRLSALIRHFQLNSLLIA